MNTKSLDTDRCVKETENDSILRGNVWSNVRSVENTTFCRFEPDRYYWIQNPRRIERRLAVVSNRIMRLGENDRPIRLQNRVDKRSVQHVFQSEAISCNHHRYPSKAAPRF